VNPDEGDLVTDVARVVSEDHRVRRVEGEEPAGVGPEDDEEE
jgi:hypothetical protein